ncbi:hypothetical protein HYC85_008955 [Camellia sinensis]|uniref:Proline-rich protein PRCC n=1 Tax=Camellia sinensis TaxID=4442 RepID=A0A7J7HTZ0_CAMSI|nr:hypothetical protein HYC85_008955 [Camellia sinensis]
MDSLLATYASSDEEEEEEEVHEQPEKVDHPPQLSSKFSQNSPSSSIFSSLPPPKSVSSLFSSLPPPKSHPPNPPQTLTNLSSSKPNNQQQQQQLEDWKLVSSNLSGPAKPSSLFSSLPEPKSSSIFSSLPPPKSLNADPLPISNISASSSEPNRKKVIQFKIPINPSLMKSRGSDDDDDDDEKEREGKKSVDSLTQTPSVKSFLSSIPAPRNSSALGALPTASGSSRRSILEANVPASSSDGFEIKDEVGANPNVQNYVSQWVDRSSSASVGDAAGSAEYAVGDDGGGGNTSGWVSSSANYENYDSYAGYGNHAYYRQYESNWGDGSTAMAPSDVSGMSESIVKMPGKRGRNEIPQEIVEVNQDELIKNRPREDQVKLTGIAFGPSYQPVSTKGKPTKLHKRKHQIGSLYFDMRQKEMELAERRSKGFLTKAETQANYSANYSFKPVNDTYMDSLYVFYPMVVVILAEHQSDIVYLYEEGNTA